jgi:hypothetical protein
MYPAAVLVGFGHRYPFKKIALYTSLPFTSSLFVIFAIADADDYSYPYDVIVRKTRLRAINILLVG